MTQVVKVEQFFWEPVWMMQHKDMNDPANQNMTVDMAEEFCNSMRFHRWPFMRRVGDDTFKAVSKFHNEHKGERK